VLAADARLARFGGPLARPSPRLGKATLRGARAAKTAPKLDPCRVHALPAEGTTAHPMLKMTLAPASARRPPRLAFAIAIDTIS